MGYTKAQYIEKFGEEAWRNKMLHDRIYKDKYRKSPKGKEKKKEYYQHLIISDPDFNKKRYQKTIEDNPCHNQERYLRQLELHDNYLKGHYDKYKTVNKNKNKELYLTKNGRSNSLYRKYKSSDKRKNLDTSNNVASEWIIENIFTSKCIYCGDSDWQHLGCDRIDNDKPHTPDNVVCACGICNCERADRFSVEEFIEYRKLHPRACDIQKTPSLNEQGCLVKKPIP